MNNIDMKPSLMILIVSQKTGKKAEKIMDKMGITSRYRIHAKGTASEEYLDIIGLGGIEKQVLVSILPKAAARGVLKELRQKLYLGTPNTGVAFTLPLTGATSRIIEKTKDFANDKITEMRDDRMENNFSMIMAFVNQGYSEEVMAAAKPAGAGGGTVFHSRRVEDSDSKQLFGIKLQPEREIVLILAPAEKKKSIMEAINEACGIHTPAAGTIVSLGVDMVEGLSKD